jgi:hypothetical protein
VKKTLIIGALAAMLMSPIAAMAADYSVSAGAHAASAKHDSNCIHEITLGLAVQSNNKASGVSADLAGMTPGAAADSGVLLAVCDSCHVQTGVNDSSRISSIDAGNSNKWPDNDGFLVTASTAFEVGWRSSYSA